MTVAKTGLSTGVNYAADELLINMGKKKSELKLFNGPWLAYEPSA